jgi:hypothetical protein
MLNDAGIEGQMRQKLWAECVMMVTYLSNILSTKSTIKSPFELLYGQIYLKALKYLERLELSQ